MSNQSRPLGILPTAGWLRSFTDNRDESHPAILLPDWDQLLPVPTPAREARHAE